MGKPIKKAINIENRTSSKVEEKRFESSNITGCLVRNEMPRSNVKMFFKKDKYCL